jgi:hypothetical protein
MIRRSDPSPHRYRFLGSALILCAIGWTSCGNGSIPLAHTSDAGGSSAEAGTNGRSPRDVGNSLEGFRDGAAAERFRDSGESEASTFDPLLVNRLDDLASPPAGTVTLRSALALAGSGQAIRFAPELNGQTIALSIVGAPHTVLKGEVMGMRMEPSGPVSYLVGYVERDYGRSALYARKDVVIDASALPDGLTLVWTGGREDPARVLAIYGDLTLTNVRIRGGISVADDISTDNPGDQPWTLARGGALAVWGNAQLEDCIISDNHCVGDFDPSRDRGAFGGGVYANDLTMTNCIVSGNTVVGGGAAGGGVYSVGGAGSTQLKSTIERSAITGNRISGMFAYGAGVYSDGGGIGNRKTLELINSTIARNVVEPAKGLPPSLLGTGYWRGGGVYLSNGFLALQHCTIAENQVHGLLRVDALGKRNLAGGVAATVGNAHATETLSISQSVIVGNTVHVLDDSGTVADVYAHDVFTGSLQHFRSEGFNRFGVLDFSQILAPVGEPSWRSLVRIHYPKVGDRDGVQPAEVLQIDAAVLTNAAIPSAGTDAPDPALRYYMPRGDAIDVVPNATYSTEWTASELTIAEDATHDFLRILLDRIEVSYGLKNFSADFANAFEGFLRTVDTDPDTDGLQPYTDPTGQPILTLADTHWFGPRETWPKELPNYPYIEFWHRLHEALVSRDIESIGPEGLADNAWLRLFEAGPLAENPALELVLFRRTERVSVLSTDQTNRNRPIRAKGDIGAIEAP